MYQGEDEPAPYDPETASPEFAVHRHLQRWHPCIDGISFPERLKRHRHMH